MSSTLAPAEAHRFDSVVTRAATAGSVDAVFRETSVRLRRLVSYDAAVWVATDPETGLPSAPTLSENLTDRWGSPRDCVRFWEAEFLVADVNRYADLGRAEVPAAGLRAATGSRPARSARYRDFLRPKGFDDELRAVLRTGDRAPWAEVSLFRDRGRPAFDETDVELMAGLSTALGEAVRDHARLVGDPAPGPTGPGLLLFSADGELISANDDALAWMEQLAWLDEWRPGSAQQISDGAAFGSANPITLPLVVLSTLMHARAIAEQRAEGIARARVRAATGRWLVCHASCMRDAGGELGDTALVIEPAKAGEIAPLIVQAYELSARERQITQLIARGVGTGEIAGRLLISPHTVRDYVKSIFEKVGVSSRGELVAKLYAEHHAPAHLDPRNLEAVGE